LPKRRGEVKRCAVLRPAAAAALPAAGHGAYIRAMTTFLTTPQGRHIAHHRIEGRGPGVVFLGGFRSDMTGTKAMALQAWAEARGQAFLRFDYSGHGASHGAFADGAISDWREDAAAVVEALTSGPQVLVGSSMGGWIALLLARAMPQRVAGLVGIAAAPDFTETLWNDGLTTAERTALLKDGLVLRPSEHSDAPYPITRRLIEDGRQNLVLASPLVLAMPVRLLQGTADRDVPMQVALGLVDHIASPDLQLTLVKHADHRLSSPLGLRLMLGAVEDVVRSIRSGPDEIEQSGGLGLMA